MSECTDFKTTVQMISNTVGYIRLLNCGCTIWCPRSRFSKRWIEGKDRKSSGILFHTLGPIRLIENLPVLVREYTGL